MRLALLILFAGLSLSTPVHSQTIHIGGYLQTLIGYLRDDREDRPEFGVQNRIDMVNEAEIYLQAQASANTLDYGLNIQFSILQQSAALELQKADLYLRGDFGTFRIGDNEGASDVLTVHAPTRFGSGGIDGNFTDYVSYPDETPFPVSLKPVSTNDSTKITYFSPLLNNTQFGLSFAPLQDDKGKSVLTSRPPPNSSYGRNAIQVGLTVEGTTHLDQTLEFLLGVTASLIDTYPQADNNFSIQVGALALYSPFTFGGGFVSYGGNNDNTFGLNLGIDYTHPSLIFGVNLSYLNVRNVQRLTSFRLTGADITARELTGPAIGKINNALAVDPQPVIEQINTAIQNNPNVDGRPLDSNATMISASNITTIDTTSILIEYTGPQEVGYFAIAVGATYTLMDGLDAIVEVVHYDDQAALMGLVAFGGLQITF